jgi:hypothetical protein
MRLTLLTLLSCLYFVVFGQPPTPISGVVNSYYRVTNLNQAQAVFTLDNVSGLAPFDKVLVIQMKGASFDTRTNGNPAPYGSITSLSNAGNYEVATICKVNSADNTVTMVHQLLNNYTVPSGKVQLVKIARYESAIVNGPLQSDAWTNATGKGGVIAIMANDLTLNAPISADGRGFAGGTYDSTSGEYCEDNFAPNFNYDPTPFTYVRTVFIFTFTYPNTQLGANKGESIVDLDLLPAHQGGKGAMATGGGGGNNHNTAGGGGSNIGAGGMGGNNTSRNASNVPVCISDHSGIGGYALSFDAKRLFIGGGGGAGHGNNTSETGGGGGNGGGIIFIVAGSLRSNGYSISANGGTGMATRGDGASGGGGGGSIVLSVGNFFDAPVISANGGNGGAVDNENIARRCYGEGGGGGGGAVYFSGATQGSTSVQGGAKGVRIQSDYCTTAGTAQNGNNGGVFSNYVYKQSSTVLPSCPEWNALPVKLLYFTVVNKGTQATAEWKVETPEDAFQYILQRKTGNESWQNISTIPGQDAVSLYQQNDGPLAAGVYLYRLKIIEKDRSVAYSPVQLITVKSEDVNRLVVYPNPATQILNIVTPSSMESELRIYDMSSRVVYTKKISRTDPVIKQDISFLPEGVYMIQLGKRTARFVVLK